LVAAQYRIVEIRASCGDLVQLERPQRPRDAIQVLGLVNLLVPEELGPCTVWRIGEVLNRPVTRRVPASGRLSR
jgi:hypothetical protein